ncbi:MAG: four helix bundle protein [bacterium]|nr:four helix bundle protein [bacterium]
MQKIKVSGISSKVLDAYVYWQGNLRHIPKIHRYSMGVRIDGLFAEIIELISSAIYSPVEKKESFILKAINRNDVLKFMLLTLLEIKGIENDKWRVLSLKTEEMGRILFGWKCQTIEDQNRVSNTVHKNAVNTDSVLNGKDKK